LSDVSFFVALKSITEQANLKFGVDPVAVMITPGEDEPR
jgi:hypothetical protein